MLETPTTRCWSRPPVPAADGPPASPRPLCPRAWTPSSPSRAYGPTNSAPVPANAVAAQVTVSSPCLEVPGGTSGSTNVEFTFTGSAATPDETIGYYLVDDPEGGILNNSQEIYPGDSGYLALAEARMVPVFHNNDSEMPVDSTATVTFAAGSYVAWYLSTPTHEFVSYPAANADGFAHFVVPASAVSQPGVTISAEDVYGGGSQYTRHDDDRRAGAAHGDRQRGEHRDRGLRFL